MVRDFQYMKMGSIGKSLPQHTSYRNQMLNRCSRREEADEFVLIDVDSDAHDVIIVDVEESVQKKLRKPSPCTVINIDDDEEDEAAACRNENDSSSASTSRSCTNPEQSKENGSRQDGFGSESKSGSTESDCSDCECVEVPPEEIRSQWEQASKRRKTNLNNGVFSSNQASTSAYVGKENATTQPCSSNQHNPTNGKNHEENTDAECDHGNSLNNDGNHDPFDDYYSWTIPCQAPNLSEAMRTGSSSRGNKSGVKPHFVDNDLNNENIDVDPLSSVFREDEYVAQENVFFANEWNDNVAKDPEEPCLNEDQAIPETKLSDDSDCEASDRVVPMDVDEELPNTEFSNLNTEPNSAGGKENLQNNQKSETVIRACGSVQMEPDGSNCLVVNGFVSDKREDVQEDVPEKQCPDDILTDRQKIKESDVYKRAMEEELEARQRQLRIQAEEAQRLRRRKKAESTRIKDMERRQKQRLEEMRETQKKDEDDLRLKEQLRSECRKKLNLVEKSCKDMASLLRKLGVDVGSNLFPSVTEVQAAYKKAMLKFHPDRASRTDMRQQVEAEEKFKLISRMKEKYLPAQ